MKLTMLAATAVRCPAWDVRVKMIDECFPALPATVRALLSEQSVLFEFLLRLEHALAKGELTNSELSHLADSWCEKLPRQRGAIIYLLRDFLQPELELGLPKLKAKRVGNKINRRRRGLG